MLTIFGRGKYSIKQGHTPFPRLFFFYLDADVLSCIPSLPTFIYPPSTKTSKMSASPHQEEVRDKSQEDFEEEQQVEDTEGAADANDAPPVKRGRGRPKGSKNKKSGGTSTTTATAEAGAKRKRGRPPKEKKEEAADGEPPAKRRRGRPPKAKAESAPDTLSEPAPDAAGESSTKKKRGRPPKKT
ncbi:uncharacterized protein EDB91DRAFT_1093250 [Suillus paluster]|uniref:uncharacterized protein n=1 Tax=Suillus paluster TaxID=48578 RepID=UPI001B85DC14|nr:uncharacterized protein EDB91DRAFT_1093250 [Suillus paluster]KAG1756544.1 hypothetical protein EDB91DRAFT_1093250 [Suillus paluster]